MIQKLPNWTREELIIALDYYLRGRTRSPCRKPASVLTLQPMQPGMA